MLLLGGAELLGVLLEALADGAGEAAAQGAGEAAVQGAGEAAAAGGGDVGGSTAPQLLFGGEPESLL